MQCQVGSYYNHLSQCRLLESSHRRFSDGPGIDLQEGVEEVPKDGSGDSIAEVEPWIACRGKKTFTSVTITHLPNLFVVTNSNSHSPEYPLPARVLKLSDQEYRLVALIYKSERHFRSITFIQDKYLWYDGMERPKTEWIDRKDITKRTENFSISEAWYLKKTCRLSPSLVDIGGNMVKDMSPPLVIGLSPPREPSPEPASLMLSKRARTMYPMGFSIHVVARSGPPPTCRGCRVVLQREELRLVSKTLTNPVKNHTDVRSFHLKEACLRIGFPVKKDFDFAVLELSRLMEERSYHIESGSS